MTQPHDLVTAAADGRTLLIDDVARLMGVSRRTVYYRIRDGQLRTVRTLGGSTRVIVPSLDLLISVGQRKNGAKRSPAAATLPPTSRIAAV
jgi:excisionase family DNA binding protein